MRGGYAVRRWLTTAISYPARHIRWKIIAPYVVLAALMAVAGTYLVTRLVTGSLEERFNNQLAEAARVTSDSFVRRERKHLELVRSVAFTDGVATAAKSGNALALARIVNPLAANAHADRVEVLDATGKRVFGAKLADAQALTYTQITDRNDRATWPAVSSVLSKQVDALGDKYAQLVETPDGWAFYTSGPIYDGNELAGVVLVGSMLPSFLPTVKAEALADVTVYDFGGSTLATTFADAQNSSEADLTPAQAVLAGDGASTVREHKTLYGRDFDLLYGKIVIRDQAVGRYSIALPSSFILNAGATTRWQMGLLFTVATLAVLFTGLLIARSLTRPLLKLVSVAVAVTAGDLTARAHVRSIDEVGVLADSFDSMTERLQQQHLATIKALTSAIDARDPYTLGHSVRVGQLAVAVGAELGLAESELQHLEIGGYLHDIGKIGVRDSVLLKPAALTPEERKMIELHPTIGLEILAAVDLAPEVIQFVAGHHEKLDGSGYPAHMDAPRLSVIARIAAVADIYDALTTDRPYRAAMTVDESLKVIWKEADQGHLDRAVASALERVVPRWEARRGRDPSLKGYKIPGWGEQEAA
jgi:putative nucleotidyltransferase with HDIG domain